MASRISTASRRRTPTTSAKPSKRLHLPFAILSDADLKLGHAIKLPTFTTSGMTLFKRMALVIDDGTIVKVFYPVFPPDKNAEEVIAWLRSQRLAITRRRRLSQNSVS